MLHHRIAAAQRLVGHANCYLRRTRRHCSGLGVLRGGGSLSMARRFHASTSSTSQHRFRRRGLARPAALAHLAVILRFAVHAARHGSKNAFARHKTALTQSTRHDARAAYTIYMQHPTAQQLHSRLVSARIAAAHSSMTAIRLLAVASIMVPATTAVLTLPRKSQALPWLSAPAYLQELRATPTSIH